MAFNNIPPNGFPALPDVEDLEAVEKDVTTLKSSVLGLTQDVTDLNAQKANQITIASFFNSETSYDVGDLVYYNGLTYRCTNAHEGEWDADDFAGTTIANELDTLNSGLTNKVDYKNIDATGSISDDDAFKKLFDDIDIYDETIIGKLGYHGFCMYMAYKYADGKYGSIVAFRFDGIAKFMYVYDGVKTIKSFTLT